MLTGRVAVDGVTRTTIDGAVLELAGHPPTNKKAQSKNGNTFFISYPTQDVIFAFRIQRPRNLLNN